MVRVTGVAVVTMLTFLSPPHHCKQGELDLFEKSVTAQAVVETLYKTLNEVHSFTIKNSVEHYVKFMVPEKVIKQLEKEKDKHIFQVIQRRRWFITKPEDFCPQTGPCTHSQMSSHYN